MINCLPFPLTVKSVEDNYQIEIEVGGQFEFFNFKLDRKIAFQFHIGMPDSSYQEWSETLELNLQHHQKDNLVRVFDESKQKNSR
jgi:hypothetical protein